MGCETVKRNLLIYPALPQTTCPDEPRKPAADASDREIVNYLEASRLAGADCRIRLNKVHDAAAAWPSTVEK